MVTWSDTQIVAAVSTGSLSGTVQVRRGGTASNSLSFTVLTPSVTSVTVGGDGTQVTITGSGFGDTQGAGQVWLGTAAGVVTSWSNTQIVATVASGSNAGNVQILQGGVWGNALPFTPATVNPHIDFLTPTTGVAGTATTIYGAGFGASRGSGVVSIAGTSATVNTWSDSVVSATVAAGTISGVLKIQQNGVWSNAVTFRVPSATSVTITPSVMSLVVGDTRTVQALSPQGSAVTGLAWTSSDPAVALLSTDDPPVITALAPGHVTISGGSGSADVTVFGTFIPNGTVLWSDPGNASGVSGMYVAVPNYDAVADVFNAQADGSMQAITSDGTVAWTASVPVPDAGPNTFIPDFAGGLVVFTGDAQSIYSLDGLTGQAKPAFTATSNESIAMGLGAPAIHPDGTIFTIDYACKDDCSGDVERTEGAWVVGIDPATGASKFRAPMDNSVETKTVNDAFCAPGGPPPDRVELHAWPSSSRIAGDGFAYLSYTTRDVDTSIQRSAAHHYPDAAYDAWDALWRELGSSAYQGNFAPAIAAAQALFAALGLDPDTNAVVTALQQGDRDRAAQGAFIMGQAGFVRPCDVTTSTVTKLHFLRVGADGAASDMVVQDWHGTNVTTFVPLTPYPFYKIQHTFTGPTGVSFASDDYASVMTNADRGALYSWQAAKACEEARGPIFSREGVRHDYIQTDPSCITGKKTHLTATAGGAIASDVVWDQGGLDGGPVQPVLQLEDDSFVGTVSTNASSVLLVFDASGGVKWMLPGYYPVMVTPGGLIATAVSGNYAFDADGNSTGQVASVPTYSWNKDSYGSTTESITQLVLGNMRWGTSYAAMLGGNPSANGTFVGVLDTAQAPPAVSLPIRGGDCRLGTAEPVLTGVALQRYTNSKQGLLASHPFTSDSCRSFFKADPASPDYDADLARYFNELTAAITRQSPYNGPGTTKSRFDAGVLTPAQANNANASAIMKTEAVCAIFIPKPIPNTTNLFSTATAASQGVAKDSDPPKNVYVNTDPNVFQTQLTPGTVLHEALHNITGLDDQGLADFVGPPISTGPGNAITRKLIDVGCAPR